MCQTPVIIIVFIYAANLILNDETMVNGNYFS
jgi:hypothetical protein